nr:S41 family peptidase [Luteimonas aestuarii]
MSHRLLPLAIAALLLPLSLQPAALAQTSPAETGLQAQEAMQSPVGQEEAVPATTDDAPPADAPPAGEGVDDAGVENDAQDEPAQDASGADAVAMPGEDSALPPALAASTRVPLEEIRRYVAVFNAIRVGYVDTVEDRKLMDSAIRGLLLDLDPHSAYLDADAATAFEEGATGAYDGIGVEVMQLPDGKVRVIAPIDDTPAQKAGIRAGDTITAVDGRELTPADNEGDGPLRGPPGSSSVLTVLREGAAEPLQITVQRETIRVTSVRGRMLEPGHGYIRIATFQADTADDFERVLQRLHGEAGGRLSGLVIDLRSNPGGLLTAAVRVADDLLDSGVIVSTRGRLQVSDTEFNATAGDLMHGAPIVVIVDAGSASASEVLAGALGDHGRARIVGSRSFGKGSVQTLMPLGNGDAVKLTTARYYTPNGRSIQARGIDPDVVLVPEDAEGGASGRSAYTEATLPGHLRGDAEGEVGPGDVLPGEGPVQAALAELKKPASTASATTAQD